MSLAEVLPAVQALTREEKAELVRIVAEQLKGEDQTLLRECFPPGVVHHTGYGLHDAHGGAEALLRALEEDRKKS
jgi:hypothetical protein